LNNIKNPTTAQPIECPVCHKTGSVILLSKAYLQSLPLSEKGIPDITKSEINKISNIMAPPKKPRKYIYLGWIFLLVFFIFWFFNQTFVNGTHLSKLDYIANGSIALAWVCGSLNKIYILLKINHYTEKNIIPLYLKATHLWQELYYCEDDNLVFDPVSNKSTNTENLRTFIAVETGYNDTLFQSLMVKPEKQTGKKKRISELGLVGLVVGSLLLFFLTTYLIGTFASPVLFRDRSMNPTIRDHSLILNIRLNYFAKNPKRGDIIIFHQNMKGEDTYFMQRVIALPEETIGWKNGEILINDKTLDEPYLTGKFTNEDIKTNEVTKVVLKRNQFFVMGDNRSINIDSRSFGPVQRKNIVGKVYFFINLRKK